MNRLHTREGGKRVDTHDTPAQHDVPPPTPLVSTGLLCFIACLLIIAVAMSGSTLP